MRMCGACIWANGFPCERVEFFPAERSGELSFLEGELADLNRSTKGAIWGLRIFIGLVFAIVGLAKLTATGNTVAYFAAIGSGQWFRYLTGSIDLVGAALLFTEGWTFYGALLIACSAGLAAAISLTALRGDAMWGDPVMGVVPLVMAARAAVLAWLKRQHRGVS